MARVTPPYFFDEFLRPTRRKEPTPRERALGFTVRDLEWLHTLYYATHAARQDATVHGFPMQVDRLLVNLSGQPAIVLAGAFLMSPTPDDGKAVLYTPYGGLELFDHRTTLISTLEERLTHPSQRSELLQFVSIDTRDALPAGARLAVTTAIIQGAVMQDQEQAIRASQQKNVAAMLSQLRQLPSLRAMLDTLLGIMAHPHFRRLKQADTRVNSFTVVGGHWVASEPLRDTLLRFYVQQAWPAGQTHTYFNLAHDTSAFTPQQLAEDQQRWDNVVEHTSAILSTLLSSLLQTYWNEDFDGAQSRLQFFARVISDKFRADLLLKHQAWIVSTEENQKLRALFLPDQAARSAFDPQLNIEKVRVHAPFQHYVDLASTLMISNTHAYLYTQTRGLQVLANLQDLDNALLAMLKAAGHEDELLNFLSVEERSVFIGMDEVQVTGKPVVGDVFQETLEDIVSKQLDNLEYALGLYRRSGGDVDLAALLDSALDVRAMLDSRLLAEETDGRWSVHPVTSGNGRPTTVLAEKAKRHLQRLQAIEAAMAEERKRHPTLRSLAAHALADELDSRHLVLQPDAVFINTYPTPALEREERLPLASSSMVQHLIARLARQATALSESSLTWFYGPYTAGAAYQLHNLGLVTFNAIIDEVLRTFAENDLRTLPNLLLEQNQAHLSQAMLQGLRGEAQLRWLHKSLSAESVVLLDSVLNADGMSRLTRHGLNGFIPDAYGLTLRFGTDNTPHALANCFVLTERGGIDPFNSGVALLWTPRSGYESFGSIKALCDALVRRLRDPLKRLTLVENLPVSQYIPHRVCLLGPLRRIDDHLLHNRQQTYSDFMRDEIDHLFSMRLSAERFQDCMDNLIRRPPPTNLPRAIAIAKAITYQQALPVWLGMAAPREQILQAELLEQYRVSAPDERDYLHGITPLRNEVMPLLSDLLSKRFPGQVINPEGILIPGRIDLTGNVQTLVDFALRHLPQLNGDDIRPRSRTATPLPAELDGNAVVQLVRQVGLKNLYQKKLTTLLASDTEDSRQRRQLFCRQLPWQLLQYAHEQTLEERLSASAWSYIQQIFDMPDAVARDAVAGVNATIRPLELIATPGAAPVKALGCYLIGAKTGTAGPLILYAPYSPKHLLKEYAHEAALVNAITSPGTLQDWVVGQMQEPHQATYRNLLGERWGRGFSEIRLGAATIDGNVLGRLYQDNLQMLQQMLDTQFSPACEAQWDAITSLFTEGIPKGLQFMAGKLAYPLVVWRSYQQFKISAEDLQQHRWQHALRAFVCGVAQLASLRKEVDRLLPQAPAIQSQVRPSSGELTLADLDLTGPLRTQLQAFETHDFALSELELRALTLPYRDASGEHHFVPLAGKVYPVKPAGEHWRLSIGDLHGPYVQCDAQGVWTLDFNRRHPRYGKVLSRFTGKLYTLAAERDAINIEAVGLQEIEALSSWKAQCIDEALNVATYYAVNCKRNLLHFKPLRDPNSRLGQFFGELFGVVTMTPAQVQRVERRVDEVLDELTNPTLIGAHSTRFVSGTHRYNPQTTFAFVVPEDHDHKIYLLDRFFDPHMDVYQNRLNAPFDISAHARATVLIHEISHLKSLTEDLAYLDSMRPFPDLINVKASGAWQMKTELDDLRQTAFSISTPASILFKVWDEFSQEWEDFGSHNGTRILKDKVLSATGARSLAQARDIFMSDADKRIDTILANADSVTCIISDLGRRLETGA
ncbi:hypothetical protein JFU04_12300 [Pseudomonas sp. TH21]|uniref:dermonecrotic toxin domain-containing protein n=1 Tax=Pseudomonas sp. TH21 TaxID=2796387 RepID=UPI0019147804|nr:DUF6543 domain-containing protein [Pseudomonas sp. TH21]MBK5476880.1 hypothetical protein [Pseudomonas sp. TH21]